MAKGNRVWYGFVNVPLLAQDKQAIKALKPNFKTLWNDVEKLCMGGYKISFNYDPEHEALLVSVTGVGEDSGSNLGYTMTQRHNSIVTAMLAVKWVHFEKTAEDWSGYVNSDYDW